MSVTYQTAPDDHLERTAEAPRGSDYSTRLTASLRHLRTTLSRRATASLSSSRQAAGQLSTGVGSTADRRLEEVVGREGDGLCGCWEEGR